MTKSNLYKRAAELSFNESEYGCFAVNKILTGNSYGIDYRDTAEAVLFQDLFTPDNGEYPYPISGTGIDGRFGHPYYPDNQGHRVTALLLMAEIAKDLK